MLGGGGSGWVLLWDFLSHNIFETCSEYIEIYCLFLLYTFRYLLNYSPFDLVYKIVRFTPIRLVISVMKEIQRTSKIHHAVVYAMKLYPNSYIIIGLIGIAKGKKYFFLFHK